MIQISQCKIPWKNDTPELRRRKVAKMLRVSPETIQNLTIHKKSMDARKHPDIFAVYQFVCQVPHEKEVLKHCGKNPNIRAFEKNEPLENRIPQCDDDGKIVIVGCGPAGLFAAYYLCLAGIKPTIVERGKTVEERQKDIEKFWTDGVLQANSNVSFGEGGAGTFSDGKLNTQVKDRTGRIPFVLRTFVKFGAPEEILYLAKPHIGTDLLQKVIGNMRRAMEQMGCQFMFDTKFEKFSVLNDSIVDVTVQQKDRFLTIPCNHLILAIGHSARDTFQYLYETKKIPMEPKAFAVGVRVEHKQDRINHCQYGEGDWSDLPAADYKCTGKGIDDRGVYSFCMCPGGFVVNASSEEGHLVVNGMSNHDRNERNANSAIIVSVRPDDFPDGSVLGGVAYQRKLEKDAYELGKGEIPVQLFGDFEKNVPSTCYGDVTPNTKGGTILTNVRKILPEYIAQSIVEGMHQFGKRLPGFDGEDTLMLGVETRTSSPVRIIRDERLQSRIQGIYPCGEGAGYAGGIMSAAMDGCKVAEEIVKERDKNGQK